MIIIKLVGGSSNSDGELTFYTLNYRAMSKYINDKIEIEVQSINLGKKNLSLRIPLVRGIFIEILQSRKSNYLLIAIIYVLDKLFFKISLPDFIYCISIISTFWFARKDKIERELHGAEHMVFNYYNQYEKINIKDINEIKKSSILSNVCSTNNYIINLVILFLLKFVVHDFIIRYFLMISLVYEMNYLYVRYKTTHCILNLIFQPTIILQKLFFVSQPKDKYIEQAIKTVRELEKYENEINLS